MQELKVSYKPNKLRGIAILISLSTLTIAITQINIRQVIPEYSNSFYIIKRFVFSIPNQIKKQNSVPLKIHWKLEASQSPNPSPAALFLPSAQANTNSYSLYMNLKATLVDKTISIGINLVDNSGYPVNGAKGYAIINSKSFELPDTDKNGSSQIIIPDINKGDVIKIYEKYNTLDIAGKFEIS